MSTVSDIRAHVESERGAREAFQDMHTMSLHTLSERLDMTAQHHADMIQDHTAEHRRCHDSVINEVRTSVKHVHEIRSNHESTIADASARFSEIEDRCNAIEAKLAEAALKKPPLHS